MWQALTAEEMRSKGLGRRSFRLEEEWAPDTISYTFANEATMHSTAKTHLIRTDKTVAELRNAQLAQQNPTASQRNELHEIFTEALLANGAPFTPEARPVVAGMILDSHYDANAKLVVAHAALGAHNPNGLSLGIFGSHLTYSWPRFIEEIPDCLLDITPPGDRVGNDNGECASMWEACSVGQGAFLHEVGHAFSAPHTSGIMSRGYSKDWPKCFLSKTAYCVHAQTEGVAPVTEATPNDCHWDIRDMLRFRNLAHFRQPSDVDLNDDDPPSFGLQDDSDVLRITVTSEAGIAQALLNGNVEAGSSVANPSKSIRYTLEELENRFDTQKPLALEVIAMNGKHRSLDMWKFFADKNYIRVPGSGIRLAKRGVSCDNTESDD
ncbi:putative zinc metalloproteinase [Tolypocladium ophioglossoides CBS 100239]|uniref:Putative zinc metalloproteinase n=1 Tax=Tolypocladium ophioglossoides (strain CBS 100239) TaxID=1163406 RepID=A0A0L0MZC5_TOLOC|nr:putative zinc metalloproteinase [Tolypocladium ophioglossoides CBS 100239]